MRYDYSHSVAQRKLVPSHVHELHPKFLNISTNTGVSYFISLNLLYSLASLLGGNPCVYMSLINGIVVSTAKKASFTYDLLIFGSV